jgi:ABC-type transport system involved in multi-copper enzyme maturation permease subunit
MIKLVTIEWFKLKNYKVFWVLFVLYFLGLLIVCSGGMFLMEFIKSKGGEFKGIDPTIIPLYDFPDVWQNTAYVATFFKLFLAFIVIISICNEINYRTLRQNIIDGLSKREFLISKLSLIMVLSALASLFLFLTGFVLGMIYSKVRGVSDIFSEMEFLPAYFLEVCTFLSLAFLLSILIRKAGFVIVLLFMYTLIFEPIGTAILQNTSFIPDFFDYAIPFLPIKSLNNLISIPFPKYVFLKIQDYVAWQDVIIVLGWLVVYNLLILWILKRRDV